MKKLFTSVFLIASILTSCTSNKHVEVCGDVDLYNYTISGIEPICLGGCVYGEADTIGANFYWVIFNKSKLKEIVGVSCNSNIWDFYNQKDVTILDTLISCSN
jgi:hypothetical protein